MSGFLRRVFWPAALVGLVVVGLVVVGLAIAVFGAVYVFAPLLGLTIWLVGIKSFAALRHGAAHIPDGPPQPVDVRTERVVYACGGCGAEVLLLVRGTETAPRHCGEKMTTHREVARDLLN